MATLKCYSQTLPLGLKPGDQIPYEEHHLTVERTEITLPLAVLVHVRGRARPIRYDLLEVVERVCPVEEVRRRVLREMRRRSRR